MRFYRKRDLMAGAATSIAAFLVYVLHLAPSVTMEDAGELIVAADYLGVPHPPGYPLWTVLAWFFQWILHLDSFRGYPNPARSVAVMSAVFGSLASGLLAMCISRTLRWIQPRLRKENFSMSSWLLPGLVGSIVAWLLFLLPFSLSLALNSFLGSICLLIITYGSLVNAEEKAAWFAKLPSAAHFGKALAGWALAQGCLIAVWRWVILPQSMVVLPLAIALQLLLLLLFLASDWLMGWVARRLHQAPSPARSGADVLSGIAGGLLFAFSPLLFSQSVIAEVYSLNAFFVSLLLTLALSYIHLPRTRTLYLMGFVFALGLTNHQSLMFLALFLVAAVAASGNKRLLRDGLLLGFLGVAAALVFKAVQYQQLGDSAATRFFILCLCFCAVILLILLFSRGWAIPSWRKLLCLVALGSLALSFHIYMPISSIQNPPMNWGNARTSEGFRHALFRGQYERFDVADNFRRLLNGLQTEMPESLLEEGQEEALKQAYVRRTFFFRQLGAYFQDPHSKFSIANQFSWQQPGGEADPSGHRPAAPERNIPLALLGLLPLLLFSRLHGRGQGWLLSTGIAFFCLSVLFLIVQWPSLDLNDLWVKRVQYIQAHAIFGLWMGLGGAMLLLILYALLPKRPLLFGAGLLLLAGYVAFPLHKEFKDPRHHEHLGSSSQRGKDFGWQFGIYQMMGARGILLDHIYQQSSNPYALIDPQTITDLRERGIPAAALQAFDLAASKDLLPWSHLRRKLGKAYSELDRHQQRIVRDCAVLAAWDPQEDEGFWLPDLDYPPEMEEGALLFGGTDPGRFVPTYMIFSAELRPDLYLLTQNALADATYLATLRDLYGDEIYIPDLLGGNRAFRAFADEQRIFDPGAFRRLMGGGGNMQISGVDQVMEVNKFLSRDIFEANRASHAVYLEESFLLDWMTPYLRPHGLIFKLEAEPVTLGPEDMQQDLRFWEAFIEHTQQEPRWSRYRRTLPALKTLSKLRLSQAWNYYERGHWDMASHAAEQALKLYPSSPEAVFKVTDMYSRMLRFDEAEALVHAFEPFDPSNPQIPLARNSLKTLRGLQQQRVQAEAEFARQPSGNGALKLVQLYSHLKQEREMEEMLAILLSMDRLSVDFYIHLATFLQQERNATWYPRALEAWSSKAPQDPRPEIALAAVSLSAADYTQAFRHLAEAIRREPIRTRLNLAQDPRFMDIAHWSQFQQLLQVPERLQGQP